MTKYLRKLFILPADPERLRKDMITEAKLLALDHQAKADRDAALAKMYRAQAAKLEAQDQVAA